jgi:hypothetical protein
LIQVNDRTSPVIDARVHAHAAVPPMAWIPEQSIDLAALRLFRRRRGFRCGTRCLYSELERRWRATGLRRADLARAIERLDAAGCLKVHEASPGPDVELLLPGYRRLVPLLMSSGEWMETLRAFVHLWRARLRARLRPPGGWDGRNVRRTT